MTNTTSTMTAEQADRPPSPTRIVGQSALIDRTKQELTIRNSYPEMAGLRTGIDCVDERTGLTFEPGTLTVVGAETGTGKTTLLSQMALAMASQAPVLYLSLEDSAEDILCRMVAAMTGIDVSEVRTGFAGTAPVQGLPAEAQGAFDWLERADLTIKFGKPVDARWVIETVRQWRRDVDAPYGVVIVDQLSEVSFPQEVDDSSWYWQSVPPPSRYLAAHDKLEWTVNVLRELAKHVNCTMIVASQLNRSRDDNGRPTPDSLRGSSGIGQKADTLMLLSRLDSKSPGEPATKAGFRVLLDVAKARRGETFSVVLLADLARQRFLGPNAPTGSEWKPQPPPSSEVLEGRRRLAVFLQDRGRCDTLATGTSRDSRAVCVPSVF